MLKLETDAVPSGMEQYYEDAGNGLFKLKVEGAVPVSEHEKLKAEVKEFRNNNIELKRKNESLSTFEKMFQTGDFSEEKLTAKIEAEAERKAQALKAHLEQQLSEKETALTTTTNRLSELALKTAVTTVAIPNGVRKTALDDVLARAKTAFKVVDGNIEAADGVLDAKGQKVTVESWLEVLATNAPHLFEDSSGAGAKKPDGTKGQPEASVHERMSAGLAKLRK
jgi:hypothetical protein